jgi:NAD(P)-dependent dehydrogenase (short-subunit alcohol dehydrogenase family)
MKGRKIILVTGANKGIGLEIVRQLSSQGHSVILTSRVEVNGIAAQALLRKENLSVDYVQMDVTSEESIRAACNKVKSSFGKLDVLINNAAILLKEDQSLLKTDLDLVQQTIQTNSIAQLAVTRAFQSLIPDGGRIIMTSSGGGSMTDPVGGWSPAYCVSKSFLNAITRHLAYELVGRTISVNAYDPGWVKTDMGGKSAPGRVETGADTAVWLATTEKTGTGKFYRSRKVIAW